MIQTVEALINETGKIQLLESVKIQGKRRALVIILEEDPAINISETALPSEKTLGKHWNQPEENDAWLHLQEGLKPLPELKGSIPSNWKNDIYTG